MQNKVLNIIGAIAVVVAIVVACFVVNQRGNVMNAGIKLENMDLGVKPGDNFFEYANGGWRQTHPIPDDYTSYGAFNILHDVNLGRVREIAETDNGKIGTLYKIAMNVDRLNAEIEKAKKLSQLKEETGENFTYEPIVDVTLDG